jgi:hypothetical protein
MGRTHLLEGAAVKRRACSGALVAALVIGLCSPGGSAFAAKPGTQWTYQYWLSTSERGTELRYVISSFVQDTSLHEPAMLDLLAEAMVRGMDRLDYSQLELLRMAQAFEQVDAPRYAHVMDVVSRSAARLSPYLDDNLKYRKKVLAITSGLAARHAGTREEQYQPGAIDLTSMRSRFVTATPMRKPTSELGREMSKLPTGVTGATFDDVLPVLGTPQYLTLGIRKQKYVGPHVHGIRFGSQTEERISGVNRMQFYYRGLGRVTFHYKHQSGWRVARVIADPVYFEREMPEPPDDMTLRMHELLSGGYRNARQAVEAHSPVSFTPEVKDTAAEFLVRNFVPAKGKIVDDAFVVICRFLANSDRERYGALIADVAARSTDKRIKELAASIDLTGHDPARRYQPGSVSFEELRRKYPPLYPDSTFIGSEADPGADAHGDGDGETEPDDRRK